MAFPPASPRSNDYSERSGRKPGVAWREVLNCICIASYIKLGNNYIKVGSLIDIMGR